MTRTIYVINRKSQQVLFLFCSTTEGIPQWKFIPSMLLAALTPEYSHDNGWQRLFIHSAHVYHLRKRYPIEKVLNSKLSEKYRRRYTKQPLPTPSTREVSPDLEAFRKTDALRFLFEEVKLGEMFSKIGFFQNFIASPEVNLAYAQFERLPARKMALNFPKLLR